MPESAMSGVGDEGSSYGYDGNRGILFASGDTLDWGLKDRNERRRETWQPGLVIGCIYDSDRG